MGSTSYLAKPKSAGYRIKSGSSNAGSDKEMNGKLKRNKIRRPSKMNEYGLKRVPDYTEMAYKEAVSKLRYFLSGNYAPSVRSYGSPSIRNLDESDGDQKYPASPVFADLKARPRLTTKYATLYADSLNYTPTTHLPAAAAAAAPSVGGGGAGGGGDSTNPDVINFIQKQEEYIEQLERESQYCRDELNNLLGKVKEVISENEHLHEAQKNKLITRMFHSYNAGSETDDLDDVGDSTGLDSDHKISPSKSRRNSSAKHRVGGSKLEGPNIVFESRIAELEAQLAQSRIDLKKIQEENNENKRKLASGLVDSTCLDGFKRQIDNLQRDKSTLESQISKLKLSLEQRDDEGRFKRNDSVELQLRDERNNLEAELRRLKEELGKERGKVRSLAGEGARRAEQERSAAEQRYTAHFDELQRDLAAQYDNVAKMQLDMERQRREENDLKREISMKNSAIEELKMELKNKSSSLQADLAQAHAEKASLEEELASARLAMERQQRQAKHEGNRLNSEIQSLRQRLDRADADLVHSRRENLRLSEQISNLEKEMNMKSLTPMTPEKTRKEKELNSMLESIESKHANTVAELESMIHSQNSLMEKLTGECRLLTDKLDDANRRHKEELGTLRRQVDGLGRSLQSTPRPGPSPADYQAPAPPKAAADRDVPHPPAARRYDPGTDAPGHPGLVPDTPRTRAGTELKPTPDATRNRDPDQLARQTSRTSLYKPDDSDDRSEHNVEHNDANETAVYAEDTKDTADDGGKEKDEYKGKFEGNYEETGQEYKQTRPEYKQSQPVFEPTQPGYEQTQPGYEQNQPGYEQTQPGYEQTQSEFEQTQPGYEQNQPEYEQTQPGYEQNQPGYEQTQPGYQHTQPGYEHNQPGYEQEQPAYAEGHYENYELYTDPNAQYTDPNTQYTDPNTQYTDPNTQYTENAQYEGNYEGYDPNNQTETYNPENQEYAEKVEKDGVPMPSLS